MAIQRSILETINYALTQTKTVLLTGPRQVGKTYIAQNYLNEFEYISFDNENELMQAKEDKNLFFINHKFPLIIDEVQYAPEIFRKIKEKVDKSDKRGQIILTGSQSYELMDKITDSLAGRISILEMLPLSMREIFNIDTNMPFIFNDNYIKNRGKLIINYENIWHYIFRGFFPELYAKEDRDVEWFYRDYIRTYIERDILKIINVKDEIAFRKFLISIAVRSGQILVYEDIAKDIQVSSVTIKNWISIVAQTGLIKLVYCYQNNYLKRIIKSPKIYMCDTGLLCYLSGWNTESSAKNGASNGAIFETFVFNEILKSFLNAGKNIDNIYYYRDKEKNEIDFIIEYDNEIYAIEVKKSATLDIGWTKNFEVLNKIKDKKVVSKIVLCQVDKIYDLPNDVRAVPIDYI